MVDVSPDLVDKVAKYLQKREGIDKTLKLIRYSAKLVLALLSSKESDIYARCKAIDSNLGVARKAFRLGKFLQDVNNLRKSRATGHMYLLEALAYGGEGIYYFVEQGVWLAKIGVLNKAWEKDLVSLSAWAECIGYIGSLSLSFIKLGELKGKEKAIVSSLEKKRRDEPVADQGLEKLLTSVRAVKALRIAAIVQDLADCVIAVNDIRGGIDPVISRPITLALAGLLSGLISSHKNWTA